MLSLINLSFQMIELASFIFIVFFKLVIFTLNRAFVPLQTFYVSLESAH